MTCITDDAQHLDASLETVGVGLLSHAFDIRKNVMSHRSGVPLVVDAGGPARAERAGDPQRGCACRAASSSVECRAPVITAPGAGYSHSMVLGGLGEGRRPRGFTPLTSLMIREEIRPRRS